MKKTKEKKASLHQLILVIGADGYFTSAYSIGDIPFLRSPETITGKHYSSVLNQLLAGQLCNIIDMLASGETESLDFEFRLVTGGVARTYSCNIKRVCRSDKTSNEVLAILTDISHNQKTDKTIQRKERLLAASAAANEELLKNRKIVDAISTGLHQLGDAVEADRCYLFENFRDQESGQDFCKQRLEWASHATEPQLDNPELQDFPHSTSDLFFDTLKARTPFKYLIKNLPESVLKTVLSSQDIVSILVLPIHVDNEFWGFVGFDDCNSEREWSEAETSILASFATSIANAIIRRRIEDDLEITRNEAIKANKAKSDFLANITHEIRTPLHGVIGYSEMLASFEFPEPQKQYFDYLSNSAKTLSQLINNILDFSRIEAGVFDMNPEATELKLVIHSALTTVKPIAAKNKNKLVSIIGKNIPESVTVDGLRIKQVLVNLLSNALKFTDNGNVTLNVSRTKHELVFEVEDTGIGMDTAQLKTLFQPFVQFDSSTTKKYEGSGLGLAITQHILLQLDSKVFVSSTPGKGSVFRFMLGLDKLMAATSSQVEANSVTTQTKMPMPGRNVLIAEDNSLNMRLAVTMLKSISPDIQIHQADSGLAALDMIFAGLTPDLVLMDLQMPLMDGFETTRRILEFSVKPVKIVALTATATSEIRIKCLEAGMHDFISKPFSRNQLQQLLLNHCER